MFRCDATEDAHIVDNLFQLNVVHLIQFGAGQYLMMHRIESDQIG